MNDRPSASELLRAVERFLEADVVPRLEGPLRFHARVAANAVAMVAREIEIEETQLRGEWERLAQLLGEPTQAPPTLEALRAGVRQRSEELARRIRAGEADGGGWREQLLAHLEITVADKLEVTQPPRLRPRATAD